VFRAFNAPKNLAKPFRLSGPFVIAQMIEPFRECFLHRHLPASELANRGPVTPI
jgi:hypothetical protein